MVSFTIPTDSRSVGRRIHDTTFSSFSGPFFLTGSLLCTNTRPHPASSDTGVILPKGDVSILCVVSFVTSFVWLRGFGLSRGHLV